MRRIIALILLIAGLAPGTWWRTPTIAPPDKFTMRVEALPVPPAPIQTSHLGHFKLVGVWKLQSRTQWFGGFSSLLIDTDGQFLALSDQGAVLRFARPGAPQRDAKLKTVFPGDLGDKEDRDIESATYDDGSKTFWLGLESTNSIVRMRLQDGHFFQTGRSEPPGMKDWGINSGPESLVRLADGRFLTMREATIGRFERERHAGLIFAGDPVESPDGEKFTMLAPAGFDPTDALQLPDGRVLVLLRRVVWPMPARFAGKLAIADPASLRNGGFWKLEEVAKLSSSLPVDNFEGIAAELRADGRLNIWLISDANTSAFQRTLLWKLIVDPEDLP